jgi:DNA segregation ATPase FtsK/SpoIIIE-like protein
MRRRNTRSVEALLSASVCIIVAWLGTFLFLTYYQNSAALLMYDSAAADNGAWTARCAAALFYLCGGFGIVYVIIVLLVCAGTLIARRPWSDEWERLIALCVVGIAWSGISFLCHVDCIAGCIPGGFFGYIIGSCAQYIVGVHMSLFFLYLLLVCAFIILVRLAHMPLVQWMVHRSRQLILWIQHNNIARRIYYRLIAFGNVLVAIGLRCARWISRFIQGANFEQASMTVPDDHDAVTDKIKELYADWGTEKLSPEDSVMDESFVRYTSASKEKDDDALRATSELTPQNTSTDALCERPQQQSAYQLPDCTALYDAHDTRLDKALTQEMQAKALILQEKLERFGVSGTVVAIKRGPVVTLYEYQPSIDTKISKIIALEDDLALALQALSIRIIAPIPGREVVGFEVANTHMQSVTLASIFASDIWAKSSVSLPLVLGVDTVGTSVVVDLASMPHVLIAGSTGSGKSVALNTMLISLLCRRTPDELKLILIDPKRLEFAAYADIAHLLFPIIADPRRAAPVLRWVIKEMEERYECMAKYGVRTIKDYNRAVVRTPGGTALPFIVVVIDELSDLMMTTGKDVEDAIARIAQMARAAGIHLIIATQRPSVDVITGLIKVNFPSRISFRVTSRIDSRTILDCGGAEKLLGRGDMLFLDSHTALLRRLHGAYISDGDIQKIVTHIRAERAVVYRNLVPEFDSAPDGFSDTDDMLYQQVVAYVDSVDEISISLLQRKFKIGFNRSARIIDYLEKQGRIMPPEGAKPRKVIH